ncbi:uncharacterized protein LOC143632055 [Bidens hawaiensis]|uniref:uncharacterized protein LOC143632055 n=1 Tax=Bidens hawaiensis TaxID=980011 RepID=UPI00404A2BE4
MKYVLGITNNLSQSLQRKDQDIVNAMEMVKEIKQELQAYRLNEFDSLLKEKEKTGITNLHYYEFENFNTVLDMQIQELGNRFNEVTTELLMCMGSLSPDGNFSAFNKKQYVKVGGDVSE